MVPDPTKTIILTLVLSTYEHSRFMIFVVQVPFCNFLQGIFKISIFVVGLSCSRNIFYIACIKRQISRCISGIFYRRLLSNQAIGRRIEENFLTCTKNGASYGPFSCLIGDKSMVTNVW